MRKLSIDETWKYTKRMWKWVAFQKEVLEDKRHVVVLKKAWLQENTPKFVNVTDDCFFCAARTYEGGCDTHCPASLVEGPFDCQHEDHHYAENPGAFYREILRLDAIRTAEPVVVEHEWVHGDVFEFKNKSNQGVMIYLKPENGGDVDEVKYINKPACAYQGVDDYLKDATFLFNIKSKL